MHPPLTIMALKEDQGEKKKKFLCQSSLRKVLGVRHCGVMMGGWRGQVGLFGIGSEKVGLVGWF